MESTSSRVMSESPTHLLEEKSLVGIGSSLNPMGDPFQEPQLTPSEEGHRSSESSSPLRHQTLYIFMFSLLGINETMVMGYSSSLVALFTEQKVSSEERTFLSLFTFTSVLTLFVGPIIDNYFLRKIGKRKTYLYPCKFLSAVSFFTMSFFINDLVDNKKVMPISYFFLALSFLMLFQSNAGMGLTVDFFGHKRSNAAGAASTLGALLGFAIGLQVFTSLNSKKICTEYLGLNGPLLEHKHFFWILGCINLAGIGILFLVKESSTEEREETNQNNLKPWKVLKALFRVRRLKNIIVWSFFGPAFPSTIICVATQYYIDKGLSREFLILLYGCMTIPYTMMANLIWVKITKRGKLAILLWIALFISTSSELSNVLNFKLFEPGVNNNMTFLRIAIIQLFSYLGGNWIMVTTTIMVGAAPKDKEMTFISTINSLFSVTRIPPGLLASFFLDQLAFSTLGLIVMTCFLIFMSISYRIMADASEEDPRSMGDKFTAELDK